MAQVGVGWQTGKLGGGKGRRNSLGLTLNGEFLDHRLEIDERNNPRSSGVENHKNQALEPFQCTSQN